MLNASIHSNRSKINTKKRNIDQTDGGDKIKTAGYHLNYSNQNLGNNLYKQFQNSFVSCTADQNTSQIGVENNYNIPNVSLYNNNTYNYPIDDRIGAESEKLIVELQPLMNIFSSTRDDTILNDWIIQRFRRNGVSEYEINVIFRAFLSFYNKNDLAYLNKREIIYQNIKQLSEFVAESQQTNIPASNGNPSIPSSNIIKTNHNLNNSTSSSYSKIVPLKSQENINMPDIHHLQSLKVSGVSNHGTLNPLLYNQHTEQLDSEMKIPFYKQKEAETHNNETTSEHTDSNPLNLTNEGLGLYSSFYTIDGQPIDLCKKDANLSAEPKKCKQIDLTSISKGTEIITNLKKESSTPMDLSLKNHRNQLTMNSESLKSNEEINKSCASHETNKNNRILGNKTEIEESIKIYLEAYHKFCVAKARCLNFFSNDCETFDNVWFEILKLFPQYNQACQACQNLPPFSNCLTSQSDHPLAKKPRLNQRPSDDKLKKNTNKNLRENKKNVKR